MMSNTAHGPCNMNAAAIMATGIACDHASIVNQVCSIMFDW